MIDKQQETRGERLKKIRNELGFDQEKFGKVFGISQSHYSAVEKGRYDISISMMEKLFKMGYNLNWLITGIGELKLPVDEQLLQVADKEFSYQKEDELSKLKAFIKEKFPDFNL